MKRKMLTLPDFKTDIAALSELVRASLQKLINQYQHVFANDGDTRDRTAHVQHQIDFEEGSRPFKLFANRKPMYLQV